LKQSLLDKLGMTQTCVLRADFYHLMQEIWPKSFGVVIMNYITKFLRAMLLSDTKQQWDKAYGAALDFVITDPQKREILYAIYDNPSYYAGYYLKSIEGNLGLLGSVSAEQNHAANVAHLGKGASWSITEQISNLMKKNQYYWRKESGKNADLTVSLHRFKSRLSGQEGINDVNAKRDLTRHAYTTYFGKSSMAVRYLQFRMDKDLNAICWPINENYDKSNSTIIKFGERCFCKRRVLFPVQCQHELLVDGEYVMTKYHHLWLNSDRYESLHPNFKLKSMGVTSATLQQTIESKTQLPATCSRSIIVSAKTNAIKDTHPSTGQFSGGIITDGLVSEKVTCVSNKNDVKPSYNELMTISSEVVRTVAQSKEYSTILYSTMKTIIDKSRKGEKYEVYFNVFDQVTNPNVGTNLQKSVKPLPAVCNTAPNVTNVPRKKSWVEYNHKKAKKRKMDTTAVGENVLSLLSKKSKLA